MIKKELLKKNFSKSSLTYDEYANVQKHMAQNLVKNLKTTEEKLNILEIGAGTGILTEKLLKIFPKSKITIVDISEQMINRCNEKFGNKLNYLVADAEIYEFEEKFDLIISNAVFQWFNNLENSLKKYKKLLKKDGKIKFSTFLEGTYKELNDSFYKVSPEYKYSQNFITTDKLKNIGDSFSKETYFENFENLFSFLKAIKAIGAQSSLKDKKILTMKIIKEVEKKYIENYNKIIVSNELGYVEINSEN